MFFSRNHDTDVLIALAPSHDVHHRFRLVATHRHGLVETLEKCLVAILTFGNDDEGGNDEVSDDRYFFLVVEADDIRQVARESLPVGLEWENAAGSGLEMQVVRGRSSAFRSVVENH